MTASLSFQKIAKVPASGLVVGRIYFETSTGMIKIATSALEMVLSLQAEMKVLKL